MTIDTLDPDPKSGASPGTDESSFSQTVPPPEAEPDPLLDLVDRVRLDGRAAYSVPVLEALCRLEDDDPGEFTKLRWELLQVDVVPELLRKSMQKLRAAARKKHKEAEAAATAAAVKLTEVQVLIALGLANSTLFHTPRNIPFADFRMGDHIVTGLVAHNGADSYGGWLRMAFYEAHRSAPSNEALSTAISTLQVMALHDGPEIAVFPRVGWFEDRVYVDLGSPDWSVIEIDREGWRIIERAPIRFLRSAGTEPLPTPEPGGTINEFRDLFTNLANDDSYVLTVGWILAGFNPDGSYPILGAFGPYGSAKTTLLRGSRRLIDPNQLDTRTLPASERDLMVAAQTSWIQSFDNVSRLSDEMSDVICRISTGASFGVRKLFTDTGEVILVARRPVAFTGIVEVIERPDLVDRTLFVATSDIPEADRMAEKDFWVRFDAAWPRMLGAMLDAVSMALRHRDEPPPANLPRMADAAVWVSAGETAFGWKPGAFLAAYRRSIMSGAQTAIESDLVGSAIITFMSMPEPSQPANPAGRREGWRGTATELLSLLRMVVGEGAARGQGWPKTADRLGRGIRPLIPALARIGIRAACDRTHFGRNIEFAWVASVSTPSPPPSPTPTDEEAKPTTGDCVRTPL